MALTVAPWDKTIIDVFDDISFYFEGPAGCSLHQDASLDHVALTGGGVQPKEAETEERTAKHGEAMSRLLSEEVLL